MVDIRFGAYRLPWPTGEGIGDSALRPADNGGRGTGTRTGAPGVRLRRFKPLGLGWSSMEVMVLNDQRLNCN